MNNDSNDELRKIWTASTEEIDMTSSTSIGDSYNKFSSRIKWRNLSEYIAAILVLIGFGYYFLHFENLFIKAGSVCTIMATVFVIYQIRMRSSASLKMSYAEPIITFYRRKLERERDMLRSVWRWYILPFAPGFFLHVYGMRQLRPDADFSTYLTIAGIITALILAYNLWGARRIQAQIDALP